MWISPPPADAVIPIPPPGTQNANRVDYRALLPKKLELSAMPDVVAELQRFTEYASVFGKTAPPLTYVEQTFDAATKWSAMRVSVATWDLYARSQEGAAWSDVRDIIAALSPAFELATRTDATLARQFPALVRLFDVKKVFAARSVSSRKANQKLVAEGKAPIHGKAAKRANKKAAAAALASAEAAAGAGAETAAPVVTVTPGSGSSVAGTTLARAAVTTAAPTGAPAAATTGAAS